MGSLGKLLGLVGLAVAGMPLLAGGQEPQLRTPLQPLQAVSAPPPGTPPPRVTVDDELHQMSSQAAVIFAGEVLAIHQEGMLGSGWVEVEFRVEEAVRGCAAQEIYRLREWAGLWVGSERYRVGQRLLMMLHAPGASGLSSPVGGQDGAIPIVGTGAAPKPEDRFTAAAEKAVDLRWIEARLLRAENAGMRFHAHPVAPLQQPVSMVRERSSLATRRGAGTRSNGRMAGAPIQGAVQFEGQTGGSSDSSHAATLRGVLALLGSWEAQQPDAAR